MRILATIIFALFLCSLHAQVNNIYTSGGISQTVGAPTFRPGAKGNIVAIDTVTGTWYVSRDRNSVNWLSMGQRIEQISGCSAPAYTPNKYNSDLVINACAVPEMYYHSGGGTWVCLNCASAGSTNLTFTGSASPYTLNSSTGTDVTFSEGANVTLTRVGNDLEISAAGGATVTTDATLSGDGSIGDPLKIAQQGAAAGEVIKWDGFDWVPASDLNGPYTGNGTIPDGTVSTVADIYQIAYQGGTFALQVTDGGNSIILRSKDEQKEVSVNNSQLNITSDTEINLFSPTINSTATTTNLANLGGNVNIGSGVAESKLQLYQFPGIHYTGFVASPDQTDNIDYVLPPVAPTDGQVLSGNADGTTEWIDQSAGATYTAGTGINIDGSNVISNTAPDQTVSITGAGTNSVTGTYPNFTVTGAGTDLTLVDNGGSNVTVNSSTGVGFNVATGANLSVIDDGGDLLFELGFTPLSGTGVNNSIALWSGTSALNNSSKFIYDETTDRLLVGTATSSGRTASFYSDMFLEKHATNANSQIESERNGISFLEGGSGESDNLFVMSRAGHVEGTAGTPLYTSKNSILAQTGAIFGNSKIQFYYNGLVTSGTTFTPTSVMEYNGGTSTWSLANLSVINSLAVTSPFQVTPDAEQRAVFANSNDTRRNSFEILSGGTGESDNGLFFNRAFKTTGAASGTYTSTNSVIRAAGIRVLGQKIELIGSPSLVTSGSTFTPSVYNSTDIITGDMTMTGVSANTSTVEDRIVVKTNSSGTAAAGFGGRMLFQGESSTTDNQDMGAISSIWKTATHASRTSAMVFSGVNNAGAIGEFARFEGATAPTLKIASAVGTAGATAYRNDGITTADAFTIGASGNQLSIGSGSGFLDISTTSSNNVAIYNTNSNAAATSGITFGHGTNCLQTSGTRNYINYNSNFAPTSGTAVHNQFAFTGTFNQTGGANGITRGIYLNQTLTAVADMRLIEIAANHANAKGVYQTGASTKNNFVGATGFGATTTPTDKVEVTGNLALIVAGNKLKIATGSNASVGTATLASGTVTVATTAVTSSSLIFVTYDTPSGTLAAGLSAPVASITNGTSFVINSLNTAGAVNTLDNSTVRFWIIN